MTPDVFTRRVALIASIAATWTFENVTTAEVYDGKLPEGAAKRFADRIRPIIDKIEGLADAPPDGAAEREAKLHETAIAAAVDAVVREDGEWRLKPDLEQIVRTAVSEYLSVYGPQPTPARTEAPAAAEPLFRHGEERTPAGRAFLDWLASWSKPIECRTPAESMWVGFDAGWCQALAARPAAVTDEMVTGERVEASYQAYVTGGDDGRSRMRCALLAFVRALSARGPA